MAVAHHPAAGGSAASNPAPTRWTPAAIIFACLVGSVLATLVYGVSVLAAAAAPLPLPGYYDGPLLHTESLAGHLAGSSASSGGDGAAPSPSPRATATATGTPSTSPAVSADATRSASQGPPSASVSSPPASASSTGTPSRSRPPPLVATSIEAAARAHGAACLDGSLPTVYFAAGVGADVANWLLFFNSGGYCSSEVDCGERAATVLGRAVRVGDVMGMTASMADGNCVANPVFCTWNRVVVPYCDGTMFTSNRSAPYANPAASAAATAPRVHMRGAAILRAVLDAIATDALPRAAPWATARRVFVSGCSAGGATAILHSDFIHNTLVAPLRAAQRAAGDAVGAAADFGVVSWSGLLYAREPAYFATLAGMASTGRSVVTNAACAAAQPGSQPWRCLDPVTAYGYLAPRSLIINSLYDAVALGCGIAARYTPDHLLCLWNVTWRPCLAALADCTPPQVHAMNANRAALEAELRAARTYAAPGNGGVMHSCRSHCSFPDAYPHDTLHAARVPAGGTLVNDALTAWMAAGVRDAPPAWAWDCALNASAPCNPTCPTDRFPQRRRRRLSYGRYDYDTGTGTGMAAVGSRLEP